MREHPEEHGGLAGQSPSLPGNYGASHSVHDERHEHVRGAIHRTEGGNANIWCAVQGLLNELGMVRSSPLAAPPSTSVNYDRLIAFSALRFRPSLSLLCKLKWVLGSLTPHSKGAMYSKANS